MKIAGVEEEEMLLGFMIARDHRRVTIFAARQRIDQVPCGDACGGGVDIYFQAIERILGRVGIELSLDAWERV